VRRALATVAVLTFLLPGIERSARAGAPPAERAPRLVTLVEAVELAMRVDPLVAEARIAQDRGKLAVLRAQLDRVSVKVDGQLQELWTKANIGGAAPAGACSNGLPIDEATCTAAGGTWGVPDASPSQAQGLFNVTASATVPLFTGFRVTSNVKRAQLSEDAAAVSARQQRKDTAIAVARAYWSVRRIELMAEVQEASLTRMRDAEAVADARVHAGLAPPIDFNRARLRRVQQEATLADLRGQAREALVQLGVALGLTGEFALVDPPTFPERAPELGALVEDALSGRPEVRAAHLQLEIQQQVVRIAKSSYYPQLALFGSFQYGNNPLLYGIGARSASDTANPFSNLSGNLTLGATLQVNLFDTLNTWTSTRDARYEEARLGEEERRVRRAVDSDVRLQHAKLLHLYARRAPLVDAAAVARDNVQILEARYKNGDALVIEYLDAQNDLAQLELQIADVTAQLQSAWLELEAALGRTVGAR
jgi:outer membrane protein